MVIFNKPTSHLSKAEKEQEKERERKYNKLIDNYKSMNKCMIHPSSIKIGCLEKCTESMVIHENGYDRAIDIYQIIPGEKVFIEVKPNSELYFDIDEINSNKDFEEIRNKIHIDSITLGGKILSCTSGKIRINRESLRAHPFFENSIDTPVSIKQLKRIVEECRSN